MTENCGRLDSGTLKTQGYRDMNWRREGTMENKKLGNTWELGNTKNNERQELRNINNLELKTLKMWEFCGNFGSYVFLASLLPQCSVLKLFFLFQMNVKASCVHFRGGMPIIIPA